MVPVHTNVHTLTFDVLGRVTSDAVTTLGAGVDGSIRLITTQYDSQGNPYLITSYNAVSGGSIVKQVMNLYNGLGQLTAQYQAVNGAVNSSTPVVLYSYSEMAGGVNNSRPTSMTYPDGYTLNYSYAAGIDNSISRLTAITDANGMVESYLYLGLGTVVERDHPESGLTETLISQNGTISSGDPTDSYGGDIYTGLDRFGRVVEENWFTLQNNVPSTAVTVADLQYAYDLDGNVLYQRDTVNAALGETYGYDGLNQLTSFARGTIDAGSAGISGTPTTSETWSYDSLGNRTSVTSSINGNNATTVNSSVNQQNEVTGVSGSTTPVYDANGNMIVDQAGLQYSYDAWNRLVAVKSATGSVLETYSYDGQDHRVTNTVSGVTTNLYYSTDWQVLEEQSGGNYTVRYVWSPVYVDAMILRDTDTSGTGLTATGSGYSRLWPVENANWNVVALVNSSQVVVERYIYVPFGAVTILTGTYASRSASSYGWVYGFQGLRLDGITGDNNARNRDENPALGRWTQNDPLGFGGGDEDLYRMEGDGPVGTVDPSGLEKGFLGNAEAIIKGLEAIGYFDITAYKRITKEWAEEARVFSKEIIEKYKDSPSVKSGSVDLERVENAVRHAYWQMMITLRYGPAAAKAAGDAHECGDKSLDSLTDLFHNKWARDAMTDTHRLMMSLARGQALELIRGSFYTIPADPTLFLSFEEQVWKAKQETLRKVVKAKILNELLQQGENPDPTKSKFFLNWTDPRLKDLPGFNPPLPKFEK